jgi:hypothetical protein
VPAQQSRRERKVIGRINTCNGWSDFAMAEEMYKVVVVKMMVPQKDASAVTGTGRGHHQEDRVVLVGAQ